MEEERFNPRTDRSKVSPEELERLAREMQAAPAAGAFVRTGGARVGWFNFSFPFARLEVDARSLALSVPFWNVRFTKAEIETLSLEPGWFSRGIRIRQRRSGSPENLIFWPLNRAADLLEELRSLGYPVA